MYTGSPQTVVPNKSEGDFQSDGSVAMQGDLDMGGKKIVNLGAPTAATDGATKGYVDTAIEGQYVKQPVRAATTEAGTLTTDFAAGEELDGVTLVAGDRILIKDQTDPSENGIYVVQADDGYGGAPLRADDLDTGAAAAGVMVWVNEGNTHGDTGWACTANDGFDVVDTNNLPWLQFSSDEKAVRGPNLSTDNAVPRFDGTDGTTLQNSGVTIDDNNKLKTVASYSDVNAATDGATITFDCNLSNKHTVTLGGNRTLAVSNVAVGQPFLVVLSQDSTGSRTVTWWSGIRWPGGVVPTLSTVASKADVFGFLPIAAGSYLGFILGQEH